MNTCTSIEPTRPVSTNVGTTTSKLALRIVQPDRAEKTRPLALGKCTVGSSSRCHIRLVSPQVRPLHCLIVHQGAKITVTRWAAGALLNGQEFTKATFRVGDCLQIGTVEVTLVLEEQPRIEHRNAPAPVEADDSEVAFGPAKQVAAPLQVTNEVPRAKFSPEESSLARYASDSLESDRLVQQLWSANYSARRRCRNLVHTLRSVRTKTGNLDQQLEMLHEQLRKALDERKSIVDAETERQQRVAELERWLGERDEYIKHLQGELSQLRQEQERLVASQATQEQEWAEILASRDRHQEELYAEMEGLRTSAQTAEQQTAEHVATVARIQVELSAIQQQRDQLLESQAEYLGKQQQWEQTLAERDCRIEEMRLEQKSVCDTLEAFEQGAFEQIDACKRLEEQLTNVCKERDQIAAGQQEREEQLRQLEETLRARDQQIVELSEELEAIHASELGRDDLAQKLETTRRELKLLRDQIADSSAADDAPAEKIAAWEEEKAVLTKQFEEQSQTVDQLSSELENASSELAAVQTPREQVAGLWQQSADREELQPPERVVEPKLPVDEQTSPDNFGQAADHDAEAAIAHLKEMLVWRETENSPADAEEHQAPEEKANQENFTSASLIDNFSENLQADGRLKGEPAQQLPGAYCESIIAGSEEEADDAALEAYMQNMLRCVRGESVSKEVSSEVPTSADNLAMLLETDIERDSSDVDLESETPLSLESLKRSSRKPDLPTDLTAMRELANSSARRAIAKHSKGRYLEAAFTKFLISLIATGLAAMVLLTAEDYSSLRSIGGWVAGTMGAVWGFKMLGVLLEAVRAGSLPQISTETPVVDKPLPIDVVGASSSDDT